MLPTFTDLKKLELEAINVLRTEGPFGRLVSLRSAASQAQIVAQSRAPLNLHLSFTLPTRLREDPGRASIERAFHVGCYAEAATNSNDIAQLSYSVLIGKDANPSLVVARKFHFDFEPVSLRNAAEPKPTFHLQLCGELSQHQQHHGYREEHISHLLPEWSQPRIPSQPMSLALVLNWLFIEFGSEATVKTVRQNARWKRVVRNTELQVLKPYFLSCAEFFTSTANEDSSFFSSRIYQEQ